MTSEEGELSPREGVQPEEAVTSRSEHGAFSFPAGFKVATQHLCAGAKHPKRSKPPSRVGIPGLEPAPEGSDKASRSCWQGRIGRGMLCQALTKMESHLVITQCGLGCDKKTATALRRIVQILK